MWRISTYRLRAASLRRTPVAGSRWQSKLAADAPPLEEVSPYQYPMKTEVPIISRTAAKDLKDADALRQPKMSPLVQMEGDPFDDAATLTSSDVENVLKQQRQEKERLQSSLNSTSITQEVPSFVPPILHPSNAPDMPAPETIISTLPNGVRVVSQETMYGQMCTVGVVTNAGSRHEKVPGTVHMLETLAFSSTKDYPDGLMINELMQDWGATQFASLTREQTLHCIDVLRPNVDKAMHLLGQVILDPVWDEYMVEHAKMTLGFQAQEPIPELVLGEALQVAAYGMDQQLGRLHFATLDEIPQLTQQVASQYWDDNIRGNPEGVVVAGAGISHDDLLALAEANFGAMESYHNPETILSKYRGGSHKIPAISLDGQDAGAHDPGMSSVMTPPSDYCRVALALPVGGWHDTHDMVTACVLQTLLGGGSSFSAGGPGKGMYSRMYQQVLNRFWWMESAEAFTTFADDGGLFGVSGSTAHPERVADLVVVLAEQLRRVADQPVSDEELMRARNMLKCNVLSQLESRLVLFEDMGRQVLTYGKREDAPTTCAKIEAVTAEDIQRLAQAMMKDNIALAATGKHLDRLPSHEEVRMWFR